MEGIEAKAFETLLSACESALKARRVRGESYDQRIAKCKECVQEFLLAEDELFKAIDIYDEDNHDFITKVYKPAAKRFDNAKNNLCKYGYIFKIPEH